MTVLTREFRASFAFVERNFNLTKRYWGWEVAFMVYSVAGALAVTLIGRDQNSARLILSLMIGATFWNYLSVVFSIIAEQISWERWEGTLDQLLAAASAANGQRASTLHDVFMTYTGRSLDEDVEQANEDE